ncbi:hypothetical protein [Mesorhizobium sp. M0029]|uniref:hypothetical protein n=1 Tax=Mesorhizobium sp. M0029 TaxID=2956850 RepID=UPI003334A872
MNSSANLVKSVRQRAALRVEQVQLGGIGFDVKRISGAGADPTSARDRCAPARHTSKIRL